MRCTPQGTVFKISSQLALPHRITSNIHAVFGITSKLSAKLQNNCMNPNVSYYVASQEDAAFGV